MNSIAQQAVTNGYGNSENLRAQPTNSASNMVEMAQGKFQVELGAKVAKASDEMLGTLIDTFA